MAAIDFPSPATAGQLFQAPNGTTYRYAASPARWLSATGPTSIFTGTSPPVSPAANALWWDSDGGNLYIWYDDGNTQQWVPAWAMNVLPNSADLLSAEDNLLINGGMEIWQRGTSGFTSAGATNVKTADRWNIQAGTGSTVAAGQNIQPPLVGGVDRRASIFVNRTVTGTTSALLFQNVENARNGAGQQVTLSFDVFSTVASSGWLVQINQIFGTGGSPSAPAIGGVSSGFSVAGTSSWERKVFTLTLAEVAGKIFGTNNDDMLTVIIVIPTAAGNTGWYFSNLDLRLGSLAPTKFLRRPMQQELALCQRYYQYLQGLALVGYVTNAGGTWENSYVYQTRMRAAPAVTFPGISYGNASGITATATSSSAVRLRIAITAAGQGAAFSDLSLDAEL